MEESVEPALKPRDVYGAKKAILLLTDCDSGDDVVHWWSPHKPFIYMDSRRLDSGPKIDQIVTKRDKSDTFEDEFQNILAPQAKIY